MPAATLETAGLVNISLINDLPLFIDPFLLFNSSDPQHRLLHSELLKYLRFLRDKAAAGPISPGLLRAWLTFPEVKQTWLGFSLTGNSGRGLGMDFAKTLAANLSTVFSTFGEETVAKSSHLEKLCLLDSGVGRDKISDFTTNLIKHHLLGLSQGFATAHLPPSLRRQVAVSKTRFNYTTESWETHTFALPWHPFVSDYVLLTPKALLTKIDTWINKPDLYARFQDIADSVPNDQLREQVNNYLRLQLPIKADEATKEERETAIARTLREYPELIEYYIREKEDTGDRAAAESDRQVSETEAALIRQLGHFIGSLAAGRTFYTLPSDTYQETKARILFLRDVIENKGGHNIFYVGASPIRREADLHIMFRLTWFATPSDVSREVNDGRGPADFKISRGALDKSIVEFKLASNNHLRSNLAKQVEIYKRASDARFGLKVIVFFTEGELAKVRGILRDLDLIDNKDVILIDARADNKPSGSKAA